jgi:hypothetical protein
MIPIVEDYKNKEIGFPDRSIDPKKKKAEYCRRFNEAIYSLYCRNRTAFSSATYSEFDELRSYSNGTQSTDKYKGWLSSDTESVDSTVATAWDDLPLTRESKRSGWYNLLWDNISPAPKILNSIHGMFDKIDFNLYVDTIDNNSKKLAEDQAFLKLFEAQNAEWQNEYKKNAGIPVDEDVTFPKSIEEFNMYKAKGGYKLNVAIAMQKLLRHSFDISKWDTVVRKKVIDDLVCLGYGATRDYYDAEDRKWKCKWIDPARTVIQFSNEYDYHDSEYAGYFTFWTISNLRNKLPDVTETQWKKLGHDCYGSYGNPGDHWDARYSELDPDTGVYGYDGFKVPVFESEWIDTDTDKKLYYTSFRGRKSIIDLGYDTEVKPISEEQTKAGATQVVKNIFIRQPYQCSWVIGTDYCFDWGPVDMASRKGYSKPQLTFHVEQLLQPSIIKRLKPILDQIVLTWLRHQNSMAMMIERGYAVNMTMLGNVMLGGKKMDTAEVIKLWRQTGVLPYAYSAGTGLYTGGAALPITPIEGGMGARIEETAKGLEILFKLVEEIVGINPMTLGSSPDPNAPVGTTEAAMQATANVLKPIMDACIEVKQNTGEAMMRRVQVGIRNSEEIREGYAGIISDADMEALRLMEKESVQYGLTLKAKPDSQMKAKFAEYIALALQNAREQRPGIEIPDAIFFNERIEQGADIMELEQELRYTIEKNKKEAQQNQMAVINQQGQVNQQAEQQKQQGAMALQQQDREGSMKEEELRGMVKAMLMQKENNMGLLRQAYADMITEQTGQIPQKVA